MEIGQVIGSANLRGFRFAVRTGMEKHVCRDEFVVVEESVTKNRIIGVIKDIVTTNQFLPDEFARDMQVHEDFLGEGDYPVPSVRVLGYEGSAGLEMPKYGISPGTRVFLADDETLKKILFKEESSSLHVGSLASRKSVPVRVSLNDIVSRHCAILAMTGSGKSYSVGVILEELLKKKGSVVVFDPHGEYRGMIVDGSNTRVYSLQGEDRILLEAASLSAADFSNLLPDLTEAQQDLLASVISLARKSYNKYDLTLLCDVLGLVSDAKDKKSILADTIPESGVKRIAKGVRGATVGSLMRKLDRLSRFSVFSLEGTGVNDILSANQLTVIDLSDADERLSETIIATLARSIFDARKSYVKAGIDGFDMPTFLVFEEAHNFAPRTSEERKVLSRPIMRKIAREGRKFGVGMCVVSQRPSRLDSDVLSQCGTQIILKTVNPTDQDYIRRSVESITEEIVSDLPSLSRGEAIICGNAIRLPVCVRVRRRSTDVYGGDIDVASEWMKKWTNLNSKEE